MTRLRKLMLTFMLGGAVVAGGAGTFASFSASTTNAGTFATGSLVLSDKKDAASACFSTNGGSTDTNANTCDQAFALAVQAPGQSGTTNITLKNEGSIDGSTLKGFASQACAATDVAGQTYHGTGNPCASLQVYVQEFSDSARTTPSTCVYGGGTATTCAYTASKTLADFATSYPNVTTALSLGATATGASRYLTVGIQMDAAATNAIQGRQASFGFTWSLAQ